MEINTIEKMLKMGSYFRKQQKEECYKLLGTWQDFAEKAMLMYPDKEDLIIEMWDELEEITNPTLLKERIEYAIVCFNTGVEWKEMDEEDEGLSKEDYILKEAGL